VCAVGDPLTRPATELPFIGRATFVVGAGIALLLLLLVSTVVVLIQKPPAHFGFWGIVSGAEVAAWQLKWFAIPVSLAALWFSRKVWSSIRRERSRFAGGWPVHLGVAATAISALAFVALIGVTVPERVRSYWLSQEAEQYAKAYAYDRVLLEYRSQFGTLPTVPADLRKLPDPDGTIAALLSDLNQTTYRPWTELAAAAPPAMTRTRVGQPRLRNASLNTGNDVQPSETVSFTSYEMRTPGTDGVYGTDDDLVLRDGVIEKAGAITDNKVTGLADRNR
jgi:hypothetical protein